MYIVFEGLLHMYYFIFFVQNFFHFFHKRTALLFYFYKTLCKQNGSINRKVFSLQKIYKRGYTIGIT